MVLLRPFQVTEKMHQVINANSRSNSRSFRGPYGKQNLLAGTFRNFRNFSANLRHFVASYLTRVPWVVFGPQ